MGLQAFRGHRILVGRKCFVVGRLGFGFGFRGVGEEMMEGKEDTVGEELIGGE